MVPWRRRLKEYNMNGQEDGRTQNDHIRALRIGPASDEESHVYMISD